MKQIYQWLIPIFVCLGALNINGQNAKQDFLHINEVYAKYNDFSMNITYNLYKNYTATSPVETELGLFQQQGNLRYTKLKEIESLQNKDYLVVIDNEDKLIVVGNPVKQNIKKITLMDLDTALATCSSCEFVNISQELVGYKLKFKSTVVSEFDMMELYFNKKTFFVEKMVFYYRQKVRVNQYDENAPKEKPKLEITFSGVKFSKISDPSFFSETRFIEKKKGKFFPVQAYREYNVIDQKIAK